MVIQGSLFIPPNDDSNRWATGTRTLRFTTSEMIVTRWRSFIFCRNWVSGSCYSEYAENVLAVLIWTRSCRSLKIELFNYEEQLLVRLVGGTLLLSHSWWKSRSGVTVTSVDVYFSSKGDNIPFRCKSELWRMVIQHHQFFYSDVCTRQYSNIGNWCYCN